MIKGRCKSKQNGWYHKINLWGAGVFLVISVGLAITHVVIGSQRALSPLEGIMLQFLLLTFSIIASFVVGRQSAKQAGKELIKPHARSAFRRVMSLYNSLWRLGDAIERGKQEENSEVHKKMVLEKLQAIVFEQIATADDALEDWRDIVPEDVEEIVRRTEQRRSGNE